jgi:hypothetical protein
MVGFAPGINQTNQPKKLNSKRVVKHTALRNVLKSLYCVIEEEELLLHFDRLGLGCFLDLGFLAVAG